MEVIVESDIANKEIVNYVNGIRLRYGVDFTKWYLVNEKPLTVKAVLGLNLLAIAEGAVKLMTAAYNDVRRVGDFDIFALQGFGDTSVHVTFTHNPTQSSDEAIRPGDLSSIN
jgi:hypothetical protein